MDFSPLGLVVSLTVLAPNLLLIVFPPRSPLPTAPVPQLLGWVERTGQGLCLVVPAIAAHGPLVDWWLIPLYVSLVGYYALWGRYLFTGRHGATLYRACCGVLVPMAILPVVTFLCSAAWLSNLWIAVAAAILAVGHIPASAIIARSLRSRS